MGNFTKDESAFNFAAEYLKGVKENLTLCKVTAFNQDIDGWLKALRNLYRDITPLTKEKEDENIEEDFKQLYIQFNDEKNKRMNKAYILYLLDKLEIKLRKMLQQKGMLLPQKSDPRFAILER